MLAEVSLEVIRSSVNVTISLQEQGLGEYSSSFHMMDSSKLRAVFLCSCIVVHTKD